MFLSIGVEVIRVRVIEPTLEGLGRRFGTVAFPVAHVGSEPASCEQEGIFVQRVCRDDSGDEVTAVLSNQVPVPSLPVSGD